MMHRKLLLGLVALIAALALLGAPALAARVGSVQSASGTVAAVTEGSRTLVVQSTLDGQPWIVGAKVGDDTQFTGKAKGLAELKPGDRVTMQFVVQDDGALAQKIVVR